MAVNRNGAAVKYMLFHNGTKLKKGYHNGTKEIWSAGSTVTYIVDTGKSYTEEVDYGATCLAPTTFTPSKDGWNFIGWREDTTASSDVLSSKTMESDPITLYAAYQKTVTLTVVVDSNSTPYTGTAYYNAAGNTKNPTFTVDDPTKTDYVFIGWSNTSGGEITYDAINGLSLSNSTTVYASFAATVMMYSYTGSVQEYLAPKNGTYRLEVYGAQGGSAYASGGMGGYSKGEVTLNRGDILYICVGGAGANHTGAYEGARAGGYNGGGNGYDRTQGSGRWTHGGGGGGATHVAKNSNRGILSNYASYKSEILIVAGGGGSSTEQSGWEDDGSSAHYSFYGGTGGGTNGGAGQEGGTGGSQTSGGGNGSFGKGGDYIITGASGGGGGGGWYGGCGTNGANTGAGGGSGYIGGVTNGTTTNGQQSGNGKATITFVA